MYVMLRDVFAIMQQGNAVEFQKWIIDLTHRCRELRVQRHTPDLGRADVDAVALAHITEIKRVDTTALVGDHRRLHMPQESPGCRAEEGVGLDVRSASTRAEATQLVFYEQFTDE